MRTYPAIRPIGGVIALALLLGVGGWSGAAAQTTTGSIRGFVRDESGQAVASASVVATEVETNFQRMTLTSPTGFYNLPGLPPGRYVVRISSLGYGEQERPVRLLTGQTLSLEFALTQQAIALEAISVQAERVTEMTTPEVATNITTEQIQSVPLNDRNFLSLALLAPGVRMDGGSITSGAESANNINVFVDGVSFKNDILKGGVAGQDASKGNPFPQIAVQEFRIITQQYKAEYQKATSVIVSATTKSGGNTWSGEVFGFRQHEGLIWRDYFAQRNCDAGSCAKLPELGKWQFGGSVGGPLVRDKLFFFGAYEGNFQDRAFTVTPGDLSQWPADIQQELERHAGTFGSPFRSNLYFGKLTYVPNQQHRLELSVNIRDEYDVRNFGGRESLENAEDFNNDVNTFLLKHQFAKGNLLNEAQVSYQTYRWFPVQLRTDLIGRDYANTLKIGGRCCPQDQTQRRLSFRNDISYTLPGRMGDHVFKAGANLDFVDYDIIKQLFVNPQYFFDPATPDFPIRAEVGFGEPDIGASNKQFGIYVQDDWSVTPRLTLNLGLRWDYETNGLNNDYVTPPEVVQEVGSANLPLVTEDYFTDGDDRPGFKGAFQPRFGFSYDVRGDGQTVLFGGFGVYYDRNSFATLIGERERLVWKTYQFRFSEDGTVPGTIAWDDSYYTREGLRSILNNGTTGKPEVFLMHNRTKPPRSNHFSLGVRQTLGPVLVSANYTGVRGYNHFTWMFANRDASNRTFQLPSYRNVLISSDAGRSWYDALFFKIEKPYTAESRWGAQLAYTLGWAEATVDPGQDFEGLDFARPEDFVRRRSDFDERHRISANWIIGLPFDVRFSGLLTLGSGTPYNVFIGGDPCTTGNQDCIGGNDFPEGAQRNSGEPYKQVFAGIKAWAFRNVDLRLEKQFNTFRGQRVSLIGEVFNVFNFANFGCYDGRVGDYQADGTITPNPNFKRPGCVITDTRLQGAPRRVQLGMRYTF
jgi:hypothetical protein